MYDVPQDTINTLALFFGLPRCYAVGTKKGTWTRRHTLLDRNTFTRLLNRGKPICVAIRNGEKYEPYQDFCVFDIDCDDDFESTKKIVTKVSKVLRELEVNHLVAFSGSKGWHIFVFFSRSLHINDVSKFQQIVLQKCGARRTAVEKYTCENVTIETLIATGQGKVVKIPFSQHQRRKGYYELPVDIESVSGFDRDIPPSNVDWENSLTILDSVEKTSVVNILLINDIYGENLDSVEYDDDEKPVISDRDTCKKKLGTFTIPDILTPEIVKTQIKIREYITSVPCLNYCYEKATTEKGIYELRANLVTTLASAGFTREDIGIFFRDNICDTQDLANVGELEKQITYWYQKKYHSRCFVFQDKKSAKFCCPHPCSRSYPWELEEPVPPPPRGKSLDEMCDEIIQTGDSYIVYKTTRAGATTGLITSAVKNNKKLLVLTPTVKLTTEKIVEIMNLCKKKYGIEFTACALMDNREACMKLKRTTEALRKRLIADRKIGITDKSEYEKFPFIPKPKCEKIDSKTGNVSYCQFRKKQFDIVPNTIISNSSKTRCAFATVFDNMNTFDVVVMTYTKFVCLLLGAENGSHSSTEIEFNLRERDIILFDEVSHLIETPSLDIPYEQVWIDKKVAYNLLNTLNQQLSDYMASNDGRIANKIEWICNLTTEKINKLKTELERSTYEIGKLLDDNNYDEVNLEFIKYLKNLIQDTKRRNEPVDAIFNTLLLAKTDELFSTNIPTLDYDKNIAFIRKPETELVAEWLQKFGKQVIVTDATMPLADLNVILNWKFKKYNLGDPNKTAEKTYFIPDLRTITVKELFSKTDSAIKYIVQRIRE